MKIEKKKHWKVNILKPGSCILEKKMALLMAFFFVFLLCPATQLYAQKGENSEELFQQARAIAFEKKDYIQAIKLTQQALEKSPAYSDIRIFLGRLYTWTDQYNKAKEAFLYVLEKEPDYEDASLALVDLEYWNDHNDLALISCNAGLKHHQASEELLLRKAKILNALHRYREAYDVASALVEMSPKNEKARSVLQAIRYDSALNKLGVSHDFTWFDGGYGGHLHDYPWHIVALDYGRYTKIGSVIARINYGSRFGDDAFQFEMDSYPRLMKNISAYVNVGLSDQSSVFPRFRTGMSLYASLPHSFEAEAGFRMLRFSDNTWIYVGSVSKYYKNFWFNGRVYLVPGNSNISHSYSLNTRYYFGGVEDYWKFSFGYGLSPDEINSLQGFTSVYKLRSAQVSGGFRKSFRKFNVVGVNASVVRQEYDLKKYGNQISTSLLYIRKF